MAKSATNTRCHKYFYRYLLALVSICSSHYSSFQFLMEVLHFVIMLRVILGDSNAVDYDMSWTAVTFSVGSPNLDIHTLTMVFATVSAVMSVNIWGLRSNLYYSMKVAVPRCQIGWQWVFLYDHESSLLNIDRTYRRHLCTSLMIWCHVNDLCSIHFVLLTRLGVVDHE